MATFIIVHGAWGGGWEWAEVATNLRDLGHEVYAPTLTGMGERSHLGPRDGIGLRTHIEDIAAVMEFEDLQDVVLCGASYGGMPVTGAADAMSARIRLLVYIDALVPQDGQAAIDLLPENFGEIVRAAVGEHGGAWRLPIAPDLLASLLPPGSLPEQERARYVARLRPQPITTFTEPIHLSGAAERLPRAFLRCTASTLRNHFAVDPIEAFAASARAGGWIYRELAAPHDPQLFDPTGTAAILHELTTVATN